MAEKHGSLSINSDNIFPIIKKWLYSDHDIFVRELVSNGCDAITKLKKLDMMGEYELPEGYKPRVDIIVDPDAKTIQFIPRDEIVCIYIDAAFVHGYFSDPSGRKRVA